MIPLACLANEPPKPAVNTGFPSLKLESPRQFLVDQVLSRLSQRTQLMGVGTINLPRRSQLFRSYSPPRQVTLLGGDRVMAEVLSNDGEHIELRLRGGQRTIVRRDAIATISVPAGEQELVYESFEHSPLRLIADAPVLQQPVVGTTNIDQQHSASGRSSLKLTANSGRWQYLFRDATDVSAVQFWFRVDTRPPPESDPPEDVVLESQASAFRVDFDFNAGDGTAHWALRTTGNHLIAMTGQFGEMTARQMVSLDQGWHFLAVTIQPDHSTISVDDSLLVSAGPPSGKLQSIQFKSDLVAWVDDLQIRQRTIPERGMAGVSADDDCVTLLNSDQFYGQIKQIGSEAVLLSSTGGDLVIPWSKVMSIALRQPDHAVVGAAPAAKPIQVGNSAAVPPTLSVDAGQWITVKFHSSINFPEQNSDSMQVAVMRVEPDFLVAWHPLLGEISIGWNQVARIESHFFGCTLMLDARLLHLGDAIREDFRRPTPDGTQWSTEFDLPGPLPPDMDVWLSVDVVDLEPAGPGTPLASPFLKELRSGQLVTRIQVNQISAGDLNRWIHFRSTPRHPERVRCRLPVAALNTGRNKISLSQLPRKDSQSGFDNCELSNLRLEFIQR